MTHPTILANRCNNDQDRILYGVVPILNITASMLHQHLIQMLNGRKFSTKLFLRNHLQHQLATTMVAGHLAGMRRSVLINKDNKSLQLSHVDRIIDFLKKRSPVDLQGLQDKYNTLALNVLNSVSDDISEDIRQTTLDLIDSGVHVKEAKDVLAKKFEEYELKPGSKSQLETIFRTQTQITFAAGKYWIERNDPDIDDILWGYKYVTVGDDRVRITHRILEGVTLPKDNDFWLTFYPPNGYNCRCQAIPLYTESHIVYPPTEIEGIKVRPDKGFSWSAGRVFNPLSV